MRTKYFLPLIRKYIQNQTAWKRRPCSNVTYRSSFLEHFVTIIAGVDFSQEVIGILQSSVGGQFILWGSGILHMVCFGVCAHNTDRRAREEQTKGKLVWSLIHTGAAWRRALQGMITRPWVILQLSAWHSLPLLSTFHSSLLIHLSKSSPFNSALYFFFSSVLSPRCFIYSCSPLSVFIMCFCQPDK